MSEPTGPSAPHTVSSGTTFRERLAPGPGLYLALLLLIPAVMLTVTPLSAVWAFPVAGGLYVIIAGSLFALAPKIEVRNGQLIAGPASISVSLLGEPVTLDRDSLRAALGPGLDARSFLMVRGYIHSGVSVALTDPSDPTPQWILTTRRPDELVSAVRAAQSA